MITDAKNLQKTEHLEILSDFNIDTSENLVYDRNFVINENAYLDIPRHT